MAVIDVVYQATIWTESGTTITKLAVLKFILLKKEFLCMDVRIEIVLLFQDIFLTYFGNKSIISTIINATLGWKLDDRVLLDFAFID
jgi:hypothetical protein